MSTEPFIGEIKIFGFNFNPIGHMLCSGQILSIGEYTALFALIGTTYGGDGVSTFALPDLRGRMPISQGQGAGLPDYSMGEVGGSTSVTLLAANIPAHVHGAEGLTINLPVSNSGGDTDSPEGAFLANNGSEVFSSEPTGGANYGSLTASGQTSATGSSIPVQITNPYLVLNYSIAVEGIFPSRN